LAGSSAGCDFTRQRTISPRPVGPYFRLWEYDPKQSRKTGDPEIRQGCGPAIRPPAVFLQVNR